MQWYLWVKAFHLIFVVAWFAGLFYLPRLFVYHSTTTDEAGATRFKVMEHKLMHVIMIPAMAGTIGLGILLTVLNWSALQAQVWLWVKLVIVFLLVGFHEFCRATVRRFATDSNTRDESFFRKVNELPTAALITIMILAVVKPF